MKNLSAIARRATVGERHAALGEDPHAGDGVAAPSPRTEVRTPTEKSRGLAAAMSNVSPLPPLQGGDEIA